MKEQAVNQEYPVCPKCLTKYQGDVDNFNLDEVLCCKNCGANFIITRAQVYKVGIFDSEIV
jgi:hydrogenase maturation factor HypF (carbamoyltransferase family)